MAKDKKHASLIWIQVILSILVLIVFCIALFFVIEKFREGKKLVVGDSFIQGKGFYVEIDQIERLIQPVGELITLKYYYTDANVYTNQKEFLGKKVPLTKDSVVFTYDGVISIGIDLEKIQYRIDHIQQIINITLPEPKILANEIDATSFEFAYKSDSIFNDTGMEEYVELIKGLKEQKIHEISKENRLNKECLKNAELVISNVLHQADITHEYQIVFEHLGEAK